MRLTEVQGILENVNMQESKLTYKRTEGGQFEIGNLRLFKEFIDAIKTIDFYGDEIRKIKESVIYTTSQDKIQIGPINNQELVNIATYVSLSTEALNRALHSILQNKEENSIFVKLPCPTDFQSLIKFLAKFEQAISQIIINDQINGRLDVKRWESGSFWVELILGTQAAITLVAGAAWSAAVISKKIKEGALLEQHVRSLKIKNESLEDLMQKQKEATELIIEHEAKSLQIKHFGSDSDNELTERLKHATKTFAELIQQGAEIHPALNAPEQIKNVFPNFQQLDSIISQVKQIEQYTDGKN